MDELIKTLESNKTGEKFSDFCIDDAISHVKLAKAALEEGLSDPEKWYNESRDQAKLMIKSLPFIILANNDLIGN
jgi:hypothetical protein